MTSPVGSSMPGTVGGHVPGTPGRGWLTEGHHGSKLPRHVVVDGSNIATEGRSIPSLEQLDEAVRAFMDEHPDHTVTVVVDATFGHRIDESEVGRVRGGHRLRTSSCRPPAGAIGRGDAFVLQIADKADAMVLSNDSFQEFHGEYEWLFDEGRLIGGKPVPHVGWVFVLRTPVRGPTSRRVLRGVKKSGAAASKKRAGRPSPAASAPLPVPKSPPPGRRKAETSRRRRLRRSRRRPWTRSARAPMRSTRCSRSSSSSRTTRWVRRSTREVESFSSHGAYVVSDGVRCYVPLRFLGKPAPRSAREVLALGESRSFTVVSIAAGRRGVDLALPGFEPEGVTVTEAAPAKRKAATKKAKEATAKTDKAAEKAPAASKAETKKVATKKAATKKAAPKKAAASKAAASKAAANRARRRAPKERRRGGLGSGDQKSRREEGGTEEERREDRGGQEVGRVSLSAPAASAFARPRSPSTGGLGRQGSAIGRRATRRACPTHRRRERRPSTPGVSRARRRHRSQRSPLRRRRPHRFMSVVSASRSPRSIPSTKTAAKSTSSSGPNFSGQRAWTTSAASSARRVFGMCSGARNGMPTSAHSAPTYANTSASRPVADTRRPTAGSSGCKSYGLCVTDTSRRSSSAVRSRPR